MSGPAAAGRVAANSRVDIAKCQRDVLQAIVELDAWGARRSDRDIAERLAWDICSVTGRRGELVEAGRVVKGGSKIAQTGRRVSWWQPAARQGELW